MNILKYSVLHADSTMYCWIVANISQIGVNRISLLVTKNNQSPISFAEIVKKDKTAEQL